MSTLRKDMNKLLADIEEYVVNKEQDYFKPALKYRLEIIEEKFESSMPAFSCGSWERMNKDIVFARAILS